MVDKLFMSSDTCNRVSKMFAFLPISVIIHSKYNIFSDSCRQVCRIVLGYSRRPLCLQLPGRKLQISKHSSDFLQALLFSVQESEYRNRRGAEIIFLFVLVSLYFYSDNIYSEVCNYVGILRTKVRPNFVVQCCVCGRSQVQISTPRPAILTEVFVVFLMLE
jgi:hypothetical protein